MFGLTGVNPHHNNTCGSSALQIIGTVLPRSGPSSAIYRTASAFKLTRSNAQLTADHLGAYGTAHLKISQSLRSDRGAE